MNYLKLAILLSFTTIIGCTEQEPPQEKQWFKGNLHTHSYWSDGDEFPEVIMDWYKSNDYQFVALTDHNTLAEGEKWKAISQDSIYMNAFRSYLNRYGTDWINYKTDSLNQTLVKLKTYEEYRERFEENGKFLILQAEEISDTYDDKPLHLNATNIQKRIDPQGGSSVAEVLQNNIDAVVKQRDELNIPMLVHVNHPNFHYAVSLEDMISLRDERFFEVYNGHSSVNNMGDSTHFSTEKMWDLINIAYLQANKPLMYGLATDDSHHYHTKGKKWSNAGRGWVVVRAESLHPHSIIPAMEEGDFYASTGVELNDVTFEKGILSVNVKQEKGVAYELIFIGCKKGETKPEVITKVNGPKATFELTDDLLYVRCKIVSTKLQENPIEDLIYETAWTQPVTLIAK